MCYLATLGKYLTHRLVECLTSNINLTSVILFKEHVMENTHLRLNFLIFMTLKQTHVKF